MTVKELIMELYNLPSDAIVFDGDGNLIRIVRCEDDGNNGWRIVIEHR